MTDQPTPASAAPALPPRPALRRFAVLDIVLPFLTVVVMLRLGAAPFVAYAAASLFPASSVLANWLGRRSPDLVGMGVLVGIVTSLLLAVLTNDPRFGLVRAAPAFALFGALCLVSLTIGKPLMFFVARAFATGGDAKRIATWNTRLAVPVFRQIMRRLTAVWGVGTLAQALLGIGVAFLLPASTALLLEPIMAVTTVAALLTWTRSVQRSAPNPSVYEETRHA
ncbi:MAG TPA: VC0807 family protein [Stellaceae bacterium]|nr:VC0807 family protein [Stellaceae bacterium]